MLNLIWGGMILISLLLSIFTGQLEQTAAAAVTGAGNGVEICFSLLGILCLWSGLTRIGERAGLVALMTKFLRPVFRILFPDLNETSPASGSIILNIVANLLGMGNAATPLGIKAMQDLSHLNKNRTTASNAMCMLVVINTASIQLLPTTLIALRQAYGSSNPGAIIVPVWLVSICALIAGVTVAKILERRVRF